MEKKDGKKKWGEDRKESLGVVREQGNDRKKEQRAEKKGKEGVWEQETDEKGRKRGREESRQGNGRRAGGEGGRNRKQMKEAGEGRGDWKQMREEQDRKGKRREEAQAGKDKTGKDRTGKDNAGKDKAGKGNAGKDKAGKGNAGKDKAGKGNAGKDRTGKGNAGKDKAGKDNAAKKQEQGFAAGKWRADKNTENNSGRKICHAFGDCGGCQLLGISYAEQLAQKEHELAVLLKPYVKLEGMIGMEEPEHYRNKVCAAFTHDREGNALSGVYKEGTHYIIPIEECVLENRKADEIIGSIRRLLPSFKIKTYNEDTGYGLLRHVMVRVGHTTGEIMVVLVLASPILPSKNNFVKALLRLHPDITTIVVNVNDRKTSMVLGDKEQVVYGKGYIEDVLCGITFKISPKSFYQVNSIQTEKLYRKAIEYAGLTGSETVLDAYCGIGTIGMVAAAKAKRVIGVELNHDAVRDAVGNARKNKIRNIEFYEKDAGEFMGQLAGQGEKIDTVFMDPPRAGSDEVFLDALAELRPEKVVYISCNPETLVRDLGRLEKKGYRVVRGIGCDMFPFCGHVETVALLTPNEK